MRIDPGGGSSATGPYGSACRDDMLTASIALGRINDALSAAENAIGPQTWQGKPADDWYAGDWQAAKKSLQALITSIIDATDKCIAAADVLDQNPAAVRTYGR